MRRRHQPIALRTAVIPALMTVALMPTLARCQDAIVLTPIADARILSFAPDVNEGSLFSIAVYNDGATNVQRSLIKFDLTSVPSNVRILSATLRLVDTATGFTSNGLPTYLYRATSDWQESTVTWNSASTSFAGIAGFPYAIANDLPDRTVELDATNIVKEWLGGTNPNYGFFLAAPPGNFLHFHSRETTTNSDEYRPQLLITYEDLNVISGPGNQGGLRVVGPVYSMWVPHEHDYWRGNFWELRQYVRFRNASSDTIYGPTIISAEYVDGQPATPAVTYMLLPPPISLPPVMVSEFYPQQLSGFTSLSPGAMTPEQQLEFDYYRSLPGPGTQNDPPYSIKPPLARFDLRIKLRYYIDPPDFYLGFVGARSREQSMTIKNVPVPRIKLGVQ